MKESLSVIRKGRAPSAPRPGATPLFEEIEVLFLDAAGPGGERLWLDLWESWPGREVMAHPSYVRLFARPGDRVVCAAARTPGGGILHPVIVRPISREPWAPRDARGYDLTTAYGYAGPFAWNVREPEGRSFWSQFDSWATAQGVITSFARLSLFDEQLLPFRGEVLERGPNVIRNLELSELDLWRDYEGKVRRNVQRARREGLTVELDPEGRRLDEFIAVYSATMDRREALHQYYFPRAFFESIVRDLSGQFFFVHVLARGQVVSSELILRSQEHAYYYLGGTYAESFALRPNDLLKHESILHCRSLGVKSLVLGGGYRPDDGILRFKRSFAPGSERPFRLGVRTYDAGESSRLERYRQEWERARGREWMPRSDFFPPYRS